MEKSIFSFSLLPKSKAMAFACVESSISAIFSRSRVFHHFSSNCKDMHISSGLSFKQSSVKRASTVDRDARSVLFASDIC